MSTKKLRKTKSQSPIRKVRIFSTAFKQEKVQQILEKKITVRQISDLYRVSRSAVYKWLYQYSELEPGVKTVVQMQSEEQRSKALLRRVAELERIIGQKQLELDLNQKIFEYLDQELGYDVKKKYAQKLLNGSE